MNIKMLVIIQKINIDGKYPTLREIMKVSPLNKQKTISTLLELERCELVDSGDVQIAKGNWSRVWVLEEKAFKVLENFVKGSE